MRKKKKAKILKIKRSKKTFSYNLEKIDWERAAKIFAPEKENLLNRLSKLKNQYPEIKEVLILLAAGVLIPTSFFIPTLPLAASYFLPELKNYQQYRFRQTLRRLRKKKLVEIEEKDGHQVVKITEDGLTRAIKYKLEEMELKKPTVWDKKWRVIIFDIPNMKKPNREFFRRTIKKLGLYPLQKSVYLYPFPCFEEIEFLRQIFNIGLDVRYLVVEKIEDDSDFRRHFNL